VTNFGPCAPWDAVFPCDISAESPDAVADAVLFATEVVDALSGRQFGSCPVTLRPCLRECLTTSYTAGWDPWPGSSALSSPWYALVTCSGSGCTDTCSCTTLSEVVLPAPVSSVTQVLIDGSPLVTGSYRVDDNRMLVRVDGFTWPRCNDLSKADTETGTWSVTVNVGQTIPEGGKWAVGELACQYIRARKGEDCRLPASVQKLVRQGVTIEFPKLTDTFNAGYTGLYLVDTFIRAVNPNKLKRRSKTYSVDTALARRAGT